jgi:hypothetical protein
LSFAQLACVALIAGIGSVFFEISYQSYLPAVVAKSELSRANARLEATRSAAQVAGRYDWYEISKKTEPMPAISATHASWAKLNSPRAAASGIEPSARTRKMSAAIMMRQHADDEPEHGKRRIAERFEDAELPRRRMKQQYRNARQRQQRDRAAEDAQRLAGPQRQEVAVVDALALSWRRRQ